MPPKIEKYRIVEIRNENESVKTFRLAAASGKNMDFQPGQFVLVYILDGHGNPTTDIRPYTISSSPLRRDYIELTMKITPNFPGKLLQLGVGAEVGIAGPSGLFTPDENLGEIVFITGGIGIAGVSSAVRYILEKQLPIKMTLFYSSSYEKDFIWLDEFQNLEKKHQNFKFVPVVTRENPEGWKSETGRINESMIKKYADTEKSHFYICGSVPMVSGIEEILAKLNVDRQRIKLEKWGKA